jgi:HPr kinase/phosphorylase
MVQVVGTFHASCVAVGRHGILIQGASGAGKSALALQLMALGAQLVADDQTIVSRSATALHATCPPLLRGMIEARGIGILGVKPVDRVKLRLVVDLDRLETERLPPRRQVEVLGVAIDLVFAATSRHFPYGLLQYVRGGRVD